jgi:hypothetical protein
MVRPLPKGKRKKRLCSSQVTCLVFPVIMWTPFTQKLETVWTPTNTDRSADHIFFAMLNLVLASAAQVQLPRKPDQELADLFFRRSQALLPFNVILSNPSLDMIRCLLLLAMCAQSASRLHLCANSTALALYMAKQMNFHRPDPDIDPKQREARARIWAGCLKLDV